MKFDLEQFKQGVKAETRDGFIATFVGICGDCHEYNRVVAHVEGFRSVVTFSVDGMYLEDEVHGYDLVSMVSPRKDVPIMEGFKLGQLVYRSDEGKHWLIGHFAGMHNEYFRINMSLPEALNGNGIIFHNCLSVEDYHKMLSRPKDKDLVWAWDDHNPFARSIRFYDSKNNTTFYGGFGRRDGVRFGHYEVIQDWRVNPAFAWAVEAFEQLED